MNSNYEWQKFEAKRRTNGYRHQAEANRQVKRNKVEEVAEGSALGRIGFAFAVGIALIVIGFMLSGCQLGEVSTVEAKSANVNEPSMGERILFHDQLWANAELNRIELTSSQPGNSMSMRERILFHDQLQAQAEAHHEAHDVSSAPEGITMADRIRFQDRVQL